ncbi:hypothetical protein [Rhodopseudomonas palustris]|uniref:Cytochrome c domain-containing protein n=1 Tax=Rhodopseudomonas palustris (strain BisB18) TaxID=316056 RepID=Q215U0_RHOPB
MSSRALSLATVVLLIGGAMAQPAQAQNLEAGKSPSQIFAGACTVCHKSPRGLLRTVAPGALPGYLRQHYTTSSDMAALLSAYLISNGATDTRYGVAPAKPGRDGKPEAAPGAAPDQAEGRPSRRQRQEAQPREAAPPNADGLPPQEATPGRRHRNAKRQAKPEAEKPAIAAPAVEGEPPAVVEEKPAPRQKKSKKGKHRREAKPEPADAVKTAPAATEPAKSEPAKTAPAKDDAAKSDAPKSEAPKVEAPKVEAPKAEVPKAEPIRSEPAKPVEPAASEPAKSEPVPLRSDPVPAVTPAPKASDGESSPNPRPSASEGAASPATPAPADEMVPPLK